MTAVVTRGRETRGQREDQAITKLGLFTAKEGQGLPATAEARRRARHGWSPGGFRECMVLLTLRLGTSPLQTWEGALFYGFKVSHLLVLDYGG